MVQRISSPESRSAVPSCSRAEGVGAYGTASGIGGGCGENADYARDYDDGMSADGVDLGFELPDGFVCTRTLDAPDDGIPTRVMTDAEIMALIRPSAIADPAARAQHLLERAGAITLGFQPRKSDYRAHWRYNSEEFDEAE